MENQDNNREVLKLRYPYLWVGYMFSTIWFLGWLFEKKNIKVTEEGTALFFLTSIAGIGYWLWCIFWTHRIMKRLTMGAFPRNPSQSVLYFIIPGVNIVWAFLWTSRIAHFVNESQNKKKIKSRVPGFALSLLLVSYYFRFPLFLFGNFLVLSYLVNKIKETVEIDDSAGAKVMLAAVSSRETQPRKRKGIFGCIVKISAVILLLALFSFPGYLLMPVYREGITLVALLEKYKIQRGVYPNTLEELGVKAKYNDEGMRGMRYKTYDAGGEFGLACFVELPIGIFLREVYSSKTKKWTRQD